MSGFNSSPPAAQPEPTQTEPLTLTVHSLPMAGSTEERSASETRKGRWTLLWLFVFSAFPVIASYFTYYVVRPDGRRNYGELIEPMRTLPAWRGTDVGGNEVALDSLMHQWLLVSVADSACDDACQKHLYLQRQLREGLGKDKDKLEWVWLRTGEADLSDGLRAGVQAAVVLKVDEGKLAEWLEPAPGQALKDHLYVVDPMGNWMMRFPAGVDPKKAKRDLDRLIRAASFWDQPGRPTDKQP